MDNSISFSFYKRKSWQQFADYLTANDAPKSLIHFVDQVIHTPEKITVRSSGSTGPAKTIDFRYSQYQASAKKSIAFFSLEAQQHALIPMSFDHVGAQLMLVRAFEAEMEVTIVAPQANLEPFLHRGFDFCPMVEAQFLSTPPEALKQIKTILLGGSAISTESEQRALKLQSTVYQSYGMTETLSHVALKEVGNTYYTILPGFNCYINAQGCLNIEADHLGLIETRDLAKIVDHHQLKILGRIDSIINTGGKKVNPLDIEKAIRLSVPFYISSKKTPVWGEGICLVHEEELSPEDLQTIEDYQAQASSHMKIRSIQKTSFKYTNHKRIRERF